MVSERPVCVYAMASLKRNSTRLMMAMCIGIALALYGVYVQARSQSNPDYMPTLAVAGNWFYQNVGQRIVHPASMLTGCTNNIRNAYKPSLGQLLMQRFIYPTMRYSGLLNGALNVAQIVLLRMMCKSFTGTDIIIYLSAMGLIVSFFCLIGSFAVCRLMCISCLGIHHAAIIYLAMRRRRILKNVLCPTENVNPGACTFGSGSNSTSGTSGGGGGANSSSMSSMNSISAKMTGPAKHATTCTTRRRREESSRRI